MAGRGGFLGDGFGLAANAGVAGFEGRQGVAFASGVCLACLLDRLPRVFLFIVLHRVDSLPAGLQGGRAACLEGLACHVHDDAGVAEAVRGEELGEVGSDDKVVDEPLRFGQLAGALAGRDDGVVGSDLFVVEGLGAQRCVRLPGQGGVFGGKPGKDLAGFVPLAFRQVGAVGARVGGEPGLVEFLCNVQHRLCAQPVLLVGGLLQGGQGERQRGGLPALLGLEMGDQGRAAFDLVPHRIGVAAVKHPALLVGRDALVGFPGG